MDRRRAERGEVVPRGMLADRLAVWPAATATSSGAETLQRRHGEVANLSAVRHAIDPDRTARQGTRAGRGGGQRRRPAAPSPAPASTRRRPPVHRAFGAGRTTGGRAGKWSMEVDDVHALRVGCPRYGAPGAPTRQRRPAKGRFGNCARRTRSPTRTACRSPRRCPTTSHSPSPQLLDGAELAQGTAWWPSARR